MSNIKVSIIVPIYNVEKYLNRCVESLKNQTLKDIEIILIDDESPDRCGQMCDEYAKDDQRIKVIHQCNRGLGLTRNEGIMVARGEYIAFIDSDDYIDTNAYEEMYKKAIENNADICFAAVKSLDPDNNVTNIVENPFNKDIFRGKEEIKKVLYNMIGCDYKKEKTDKKLELGGVVKALYRTNLLKQNNIKFYSEREYISEDYIFHLDVIPKCNCITFVEGIYYYYCRNTTSLTHTYKADRLEKNIILYKEIERKTKNLNIYEDVKKGISSLFLGSVRACIKQECSNDKKLAVENIKKICNNDYVHSNVKVNFERTLKQKIFDLFIFLKLSRMLYLISNKVKNK